MLSVRLLSGSEAAITDYAQPAVCPKNSGVESSALVANSHTVDEAASTSTTSRAALRITAELLLQLERTMPPTTYQATYVMLSLTGLCMLVFSWTHPETFSVSAEHFAEILRHRRALRSDETAQRKLLFSPTSGVATLALLQNPGIVAGIDDPSSGIESVSLEALVLSELDPEDRKRFFPNALFEANTFEVPDLEEDEYEQRMSLFLQSLDGPTADENDVRAL